MNKVNFISILLVPNILIIFLSGCAAEEITFKQLFENPEQYNGKEITIEGFYFHGFELIIISRQGGKLGQTPIDRFYFNDFESILLTERLEPSGFTLGHLTPKGRKIWVEGGIPINIYNMLNVQQMLGRAERYGKMRITGKFEYGGSYGYLGGFSSQITPSKVELLPWTS